LVVPCTNFLPLISRIEDILDEVVDLIQEAEHNRRICDVLKQRVYVAYLAVFEIKVKRSNYQEFFNKKNYLYLQHLVTVIEHIKNFIENISKIKKLLKFKYVQTKSIEKTFKELCKDFDICIINIDTLDFTTTIKSKIHLEEAEALKADQEELKKVSFKISLFILGIHY
jgi:hypothetical protein